MTFFTVTIPGYWSSFLTMVSGWGATIMGVLSQGWQNIVQFFTGTIPAFIASVGEWFGQLPGMIYDMIVNILAHFLAWGIMLNDFVTTNIAGFIGDVVDWFKQLPGKIHEWITKAMTNVETWGTNLILWATTKPAEFVNNIISFICTLPAKLWEWFTQSQTKVTNWGNDLITWATTKPKEFVDNIINKVSEIAGEMWNKFLDATQKVRDWGDELLTAGANAAKVLFDAVMDGLEELPAKVFEMGENVVKGFWNGIESLRGWIGDKVSKFFNDIVDKAMDILDEHSPSKVFRTIGANTIRGYGLGLDDETKAALKKTGKIFTDIIDTGKSAASGALGNLSVGRNTAMSGRGYGQAEPQVKTVNYNFYQTNNSPKALSRREVYRQSRNLLKGAALAHV